MSTPGDAYGASLPHKQYFCYTCNQNVLIDASAGELSCPECRAAFLEEVTDTAPTIHSFPFALMHTASSPSRSSSSSTAAPPPSDLSNFVTSFLGLRSGAASAADTATPEPFDRLVFFQNYIRRLEERGVDIQLLLDGNLVNLVPDGFSDDVDGRGLEELMELISENDPNRYGLPPATEWAVSKLGDVMLTDAMIAAAEGAECAVCMVDFSPGDGAKEMPCKHIYHSKCISRWLALRNSCPVCRFQLPTNDDDPGDEGNNASNQQPTVGIASSVASGSSTTSEEGGGHNAMVPRPFGGLGRQTPQQDGNNGGAGSSSQDIGS